MGFRKDFIWGAATAAYQVEGAAFEDGKGLSVWDMCCKRPKFVEDGNVGSVACDNYHRYKEDVQIMKEIGLKAYRMSISWPRVIPNGVGKVNEKGLEFYDRLIDELLKNDITPYVTLYHWDFPYELYKKGEWLNSDSPDWFADYTKVVVERLSDRVKNWITLNEPQCFIGLGHYTGDHAPGLKLGMSDVLLAAHNALLAHGKAVKTIRSYAKQKCNVGCSCSGYISIPDTDSADDIEAAKSMMFDPISSYVGDINSWWMDPLYLGKYPEKAVKVFEKYMPDIKPDDMKTICQPLDFFGINIYNGSRVRKGQDGKPEFVKLSDGYAHNAFNWPITPECLYWGPKFFYERYHKPLILTENGMSNIDWVSVDGKVHDPQRIDYLYRYIKEFKRAADSGIDIRGYFCWSLMDNFEWASGFNQRFGLVYVDYPTQKRTIKDSGYWYKKLIESNGDIIK